MQLENNTPFPASIFRTVIDDTRMAAAVVMRVTYDLRDGKLLAVKDQIWPVSGPPFDGPQGPMDSDELFYRGGVDVFVFGHACAADNQPVREMQVSVTLPGFEAVLDILGDRIWQKDPHDGDANGELGNDEGDRSLCPSPAEPFTAMPLCAARAFGGSSEWDELAMPYPDNPEGRGYHLERDQALGAALPNIEDPDARIRSWEDRPVPVGTWILPTGHPIRTRNGFISPDGTQAGLRPTFFNAAFPRMIAPHAAPGQWMRINGVHPQGPVVFELPQPPLELYLYFEPDWIRHALAIDQIGVEVNNDRAFVTYRYPFRYTIHRLQKRRAVLVSASAVGPPP